MKTTKIQVSDMQSPHCQLRVREALKNIPGVTVNAIQAGSADVTVDQDSTLSQVTAAITKAGYTVQETSSESANTDGTLAFKTNINCGGCVAKVTPALNAAEGIGSWEVDTVNKDKILSVKSTGITRDQVIEAVQKAGFRIEPIEQ